METRALREVFSTKVRGFKLEIQKLDKTLFRQLQTAASKNRRRTIPLPVLVFFYFLN